MAQNKPDSPVPPLFVRTRHLPVILGVSERKAKQLIASGELPSVKLDGCVLIPVSGLLEFEARLRNQARVMVDHDAVLERLRADLARQRLPEHVEDPAVLATIGALLRRPTPKGPQRKEEGSDAYAA